MRIAADLFKPTESKRVRERERERRATTLLSACGIW